MILGIFAWRTGNAQDQGAGALVIQGGTLIDGTGAPARPIKGIVIVGNRIREIVPAQGILQAPPGARVVSADGLTILPGLFDAHVHYRGFDGELYLAYGVTSVLDLGNVSEWIVAQQEGEAKGKIFGPRIFHSGGILIGEDPAIHSYSMEPKNVEEAALAAQKSISVGANVIKIHELMTPPQIKAVAEVGRRAGINVIGHLGRFTDAREAAEAEINAIAHVSGVETALAKSQKGRSMSEGTSSKFDDSDIAALAKFMVDKHVIMEPDLVVSGKGVYKQSAEFAAERVELLSDAHLGYIWPSARDRWLYETGYGNATKRNAFTPATQADEAKYKENSRKEYELEEKFLKAFVAAGGELLAGTDSQHFVMPGMGLQQEMQLLVENVGISPMEAIKAATINPARFVHHDKDLGTVEPGKLADIIFVQGDPLQNIHNLRNIRTVIKNGTPVDTSFHSWYQNPIPRPTRETGGTNPVPIVTSISTTIATERDKETIVTIKGSRFAPGCIVTVNGRSVPIISGNRNELTVRLQSQDLVQVGTLPVVVFNPAPEGGYSEPRYFIVKFR